MSSDSKLNLLGCGHASDQTAEHGLECPAVRNFHLNVTEMFFKFLKSIKYLFTLYTVVSSCTGTQKKETLTNCVITPCMVMKTKGIPSCTGTPGQPPLHPKVIMHILHTVLYTFPKVLTRRICLPIKSFFCWASFPLFS